MTPTLNSYDIAARTLADDVIEVISNDRETYEAVTGTLASVCRTLDAGDPGRMGELVRELLTRAYLRHGVDAAAELDVVETLTSRLLSLVDWRKVGEHFLTP